MSTKTKLEGHTEMLAWNRSWKPHHLPLEFRKRVRRAAIKRKEWQRGTHEYQLLRHPLWDHWGSAKVQQLSEGYQILCTQPYGDHMAEAEAFALEHNLLLTATRGGPWHPNTYLYVFRLPDGEKTARHSFRDEAGLLHVDCSECEQGRKGLSLVKCAAGWLLRRGERNNCLKGALRKEFAPVPIKAIS